MKPIFMQWNKRIAEKLDVHYSTEDWYNYVDKNIVIEIVKLLQTRKGIRVSELADKLGVSEKTAKEDACRIEHAISAETFEAVKKYISKTYPQDI
jgi:Mn-dependent DtxR family transcriptional regulator